MGIWQGLTHRVIDTHCHLHHYENSENVISQVKKQGMKVHLVTVHPSEYEKCLKMTEGCENIFVSLGIFPLYIDQYEHEMDLFWELLPQVKFIGEIGLDFTAESYQINKQVQLFTRIIESCNEQGGKVLSIHSRRAGAEVLDILGSEFNGTAIMHWYSCPADLTESAPDNVYFSVNTAMLKSRSGKEILAVLPKHKILTETDGPYVKINENSAVPSDISIVVNGLSARWNCSIEEVLSVIEENYKRAVSF